GSWEPFSFCLCKLPSDHDGRARFLFDARGSSSERSPAQPAESDDPGDRGQTGPGRGGEGEDIHKHVHVRRGGAAGVGVEVELEEGAEEAAGRLEVEPGRNIDVAELCVVEEAGAGERLDLEAAADEGVDRAGPGRDRGGVRITVADVHGDRTA